MRGDRRTPVAGGGTTAVPARDAGRVRAGLVASVASMEVREPLRRSLAPFGVGLGGEPLPPLPTPTTVPDPC
ncbi:hypothetical protein BFF78_24945 [Streptomyces fodineus]|uniref:Uncharacterized protein n=1 Tax=Streptomyces fodineus TaxID=1904616 RepID=A0A1D7YEF1_9ACTN|nr:hypothetical protein BFF78_24945 [Streptomyces fodineus]